MSRGDLAPGSAAAMRSRQKAIAEGRALRVDTVLRDPQAIAAFQRLKRIHGSVAAVVTHALRECDESHDGWTAGRPGNRVTTGYQLVRTPDDGD